jgi:hypothetical protein
MGTFFSELGDKVNENMEFWFLGSELCGGCHRPPMATEGV